MQRMNTRKVADRKIPQYKLNWAGWQIFNHRMVSAMKSASEKNYMQLNALDNILSNFVLNY